MGNNPSTNSKPHSGVSSATASPSNNESPRAPPSRRDPKNLIPSQRTAPPEQSQASARGVTVHRPRASQSIPVSQFNDSRSSHHTNHSGNHSTTSSPKQPKPETKPIEVPSQPVAVPIPTSNPDSGSSRSHQAHSFDPSGPPSTQDMSYHLTRPPRLPLPIEEEVHTPGSPIIAPADDDEEVPSTLDIDNSENEALPRKSSALSNTTIDDEDDAEELQVDKTKATVPTVFEWTRGGEKVYVTGSIFQWNRKHRLHPVADKPGILRSTIYVRPGTHHVRFLVDGNMQCSPDLPTTVDFGNNLVNYVEVSADDLPTSETPASLATGTGAPVMTVEETVVLESKVSETKTKETQKPAPKTKFVMPASNYTSEIPRFLEDLDKPEDTREYQAAAIAIEKLPTPPSLPGFLGKPILNAATPMKDDNSVLIMPNHTVLNHLATSSIKNNVLAVSATTRYKRKYVTTIMYKPTGDD
ncbi:AMPKBI-domain-containing protein [Coleophoma crateriformis]|uniref:AMPKBI-domain-containing protein n=1 Tax=Coleophoma crateriformis TaxID=565419 RepID=A0A3D8R871_9HELO|nr:AMPKBI-domain-containing protein [Coleophoma crateriformis]